MKRNNLKRYLCAFLAGILLLATLSSCTNTSNGNSDSTENESQNGTAAQAYRELVLVRPGKCSGAFLELCKKLKDFLSQNTEMKISLKSDDLYEYETAEGRGYLLLGTANFALSQKAADSAREGSVVYLHEDDCTAIYAEDDTLMWVGVQQFLNDCFADGALSIGKEYSEKVSDLSDCTRTGWFQPFPAYTDGTLDETLYSCGTGLNESEDPSELQIVENTSADAYYAYVEKLENLGYTLTFNNYIDGNCYSAFSDLLGNNAYVYYMTQNGEKGTVRAICDRSSVSLEDFCYTTAGSDDTEFYMFNLNTSSEDTFLIHTADNSWIFLDGGVTNWSGTDVESKFADALFDFMWERSGLQEGEKLVISCWYLSHAHRDHFLAFGALIEKYHDKIELQRMLANVPDPEIADHNSNATEFRTCMKTITTYYPDLTYLKAHTGMKIQLADVEFTILYTQEDMVDFWVKNREDYYSKWVNWSSMSKSDANYATYRDNYKLYDYNNASINSIISVNGMTVLQLGDGYRTHEWMAPYYTTNTLTTDILKVAHHFYNDETVDFYKTLTNHQKPLYVLINHASYTTSSNKTSWLNSLSSSKGQYCIEASYTKIYGFQKNNGILTKEEITAAYSWQLTQQ